MKKLTLIACLIVMIQATYAQSPKAVLKSLTEGDIIRSTQKFEKISDKYRDKMPEMCHLAEAALLNMPKQVGTNKIHGYEILATNIDAIRSSTNIEKTFDGLDTTLDEVIATIEKQSFDYVMTLDSERHFVIYINWATMANHPNISELEQRLEELRYNNTMHNNSVEDCDYFLATYPTSEYYAEVEAHRTMLLYNEAMASYDEELIERFVIGFPNYDKTSDVANRLMTLRHNRIFVNGNNLDQMKWFVEQYPNHPTLHELKQQMADIEFETLTSTCEALEAFVAYYGNVTQYDEVVRRLYLARIAENGTPRALVEYVRSYGYDEYYPFMLRQIYQHSKRYILTPDLKNITMLRYASEEGLVGYIDLDGNPIIEPIYDAATVEFGISTYDNAMLAEFTTERNIVALRLNGAWGVVDNRGNSIVEHKYQALTIYNNQIYAVKDVNACESECMDALSYICDIYDLSGELIKKGERTEWLAILPMRESIMSDGTHRGTYLTPKYCYELSNGAYYIVDRDGNSYTTDWIPLTGVTDNIAVVKATVDGVASRYFANLDTRELIKECPYSIVYPMSCGRAAVYVEGKGYGFIDDNLELKIAAEHGLNHATTFNCGLMVVYSNDGIFSIINTEGEYILTTKSEIQDMHTGGNDKYITPGMFMISDETTHTIVDCTGTTLATIESSYPPHLEGIFVVGSNGRVMLNLEAN